MSNVEVAKTLIPATAKGRVRSCRTPVSSKSRIPTTRKCAQGPVVRAPGIGVGEITLTSSVVVVMLTKALALWWLLAELGGESSTWRRTVDNGVEEGSRLIHRCPGSRASRRWLLGASDVEAELNDVTIGHHIILTLDAGLAAGLGFR